MSNKVPDSMVKEFLGNYGEPLRQEPQRPQSIADKAKEIIYGDRESCYGDPGKNLRCIADMWSSYLDVDVTGSDVCNMMVLLKVERLKNSPYHEDSMVDIIGYTLLQERLKDVAKKE